jgi:hypothetical protein
LKREKRSVAAARLFTRKNLHRAGSEKGDELGEGCRELMCKGDLADRSEREVGEGWVSLPKNMKNDLSIAWICVVTVGIPIGGVAMYFNISRKSSPILG